MGAQMDAFGIVVVEQHGRHVVAALVNDHDVGLQVAMTEDGAAEQPGGRRRGKARR
jgi:hypothetical protein